jgi:hypothetical protein
LFLFRLRNPLNFQVPNFELKPNCTPWLPPIASPPRSVSFSAKLEATYEHSKSDTKSVFTADRRANQRCGGRES